MTRHAQITRSHVIYGAEQETHVRVDIFDVVSGGIRRRVDSLDISLPGATDDPGVIRRAVENMLVHARLMADGDRVLTEAEARHAMMQGVDP